MYKLGLVSVSFRGLSADEIIGSVKSSGLSCIEWGSDVHAPYDDPKQLKYIAARCADENIDICSYGSYFEIDKTPSDELIRYIEAAKILGTDTIRIWAGTRSYSEYSALEREKFFDECRSFADTAEKSGVKLCLECHNNTFTDCLDGALSLMKAVNSPAFRMYWQPNQYRTVNENMQYAREIAPYTTHLHVFNWEGNNRYPLSEAIPLWQDYLAQFSGDRCLLLEFMPDDDPATLPIESAVLKKIAAQ